MAHHDIIKMTEGLYETNLTRSWISGKRNGVEDARKFILDLAKEAFSKGNDKEAMTLRTLSADLASLEKDFQEQATEYDRTYVEPALAESRAILGDESI